MQSKSPWWTKYFWSSAPRVKDFTVPRDSRTRKINRGRTNCPHIVPGSSAGWGYLWVYNLANIFANSDGEQDLPDDNEWEEVDDFEWDDSDPILNNDSLHTRISTYALAMDDDFADEDCVPPEVAKQLRKRKRKQKGQIKLDNWATQDDRQDEPQPTKTACTEASSSATQYINLNSDSEEEDFDTNAINLDVSNEADLQVELGTVDLSPAQFQHGLQHQNLRCQSLEMAQPLNKTGRKNLMSQSMQDLDLS
ncbi:hypothetical protein B0H14DRAFT_2560646 [Mycena olivaceomarginata]|nr:hypothetical protein B0H14DRAFT_2560646 [Mycena olivaceomarginata]